MSYEAWPTSILPRPTLGLRGELTPTMARTGKGGFAISEQRNRFARVFKAYQVAWDFNDQQFGLFQSWVLYKIHGGADWFEIDLPNAGAGFVTVRARIQEGAYTFSHQGNMNWQVTATLEIEAST